ncbi:MAG TPA: toll/interleukin-1 receptor domain-containing protein, partial [Thermoanaerobaculia bacterium]
MSFAFDVFISHAGADKAFAVELARSLEKVGLRVWLDEEQISPGDSIDDSLLRGLKSAQHGLFVVTDAWLERKWTKWELDSFVQDGDRERRLLVVQRIPRDVQRLGPELRDLKPIDWPEGDPEPEARLWELRCGILGQPPGPRAQWTARWREAVNEKGGPALMARTPAEATARALLTLNHGARGQWMTVDRKAQWGQVITEAARPEHQAIFVLGPQRRGHELFLERVERLPKDPPRTIHTVRWGLFTPASKALFFDALAKALDDCPVERLAPTLRGKLADQNVILLHRPVCEKDFEEEAFLSYYTTWLPELIAEVDQAPRQDDRIGAVKLVQGIAWCPSPQVRRGIAHLIHRMGIGGTWVEESLQQSAAEAAIARLRREAERRRAAGL